MYVIIYIYPTIEPRDTKSATMGIPGMQHYTESAISHII